MFSFHKSLIVIVVMSLAAFVCADAELTDHWGPCPALPAVVHAVTVSPLQQIIALGGEWDFVTDPRLMGRHRMGKGPGRLPYPGAGRRRVWANPA